MSCLSWRHIFHESWENKSKFQIGGLQETGGLPLFPPVRAHLLTTASAQTPYPSPRRKRQVSSIPLCLLFPQSQRLCGSPFAAVVLPAATVRSARRMRLLREPYVQCHITSVLLPLATQSAICFASSSKLLFPFWKQPAACPHKAATGSFICGYGYRLPQYPFSFCEKETKTRAKGR